MAIVPPFSIYSNQTWGGGSVNRALFVLFFAVAGCFAQSTSSISGAVTDSSGAVIPGAAVTVTNEETGVVNRQTTTDSGLFSFPALPVGVYTISFHTHALSLDPDRDLNRIAAPGCGRLTHSGRRLMSGRRLPADAAEKAGHFIEV